MRSNILLAIVPALWLGTTACRGPSDPVKVKAIGEMTGQVDGLLLQLNAVDLPRYARMDSVFRTSQEQAIEEMLRDTLDRERALLVGNYFRAMDRAVPRVRRETPRLIDELARSKMQLKDLRHDIDRGLLPDGPKNTYFDQEKLVVEQLDRSTGVVLQSQGTADRAWSDRQAVDSLIMSHAEERAERP